MAKSIVAKSSKAKPKYKRVTVEQFTAMKNIADAYRDMERVREEREVREQQVMQSMRERRSGPIDRDFLETSISNIGTMAYSLRTMAIQDGFQDDDPTVVQLYCEKIGWLSDQILAMLGEPSICGDFASWADFPKPGEVRELVEA